MDEANISLNSPVTELKGVGESVRELLEKIDVQTVEDLTTLLPNRLEDRRNLVPVKQLIFGVDAVIDVEILKVSTRRSKTGRLIIEAKARDWSGEVPVLWFNQRFILKTVTPGKRLLIFGAKKPAKSMGHPFFAKKIIDQAELVPIYPTTAGLSQWRISKLLEAAKPLFPEIKSFLPENSLVNLELPTKADALAKCHFEREINSLDVAKKVLSAEEIFKLALRIIEARNKQSEQSGLKISPDFDFVKKVVEKLGFELTDSQRRAAWEILKDLEQEQPMNRLLYGEVGSGKTAVAQIVTAAILNAGYQVAILAPTVALADQHYQNLSPFFSELGYVVTKLTGSSKDKTSNADLFIGTHALLNENERFKNIGLIIIDEQHRFGVAQRQKLLEQKTTPHLLMMTATPIPRSLAQTLFGHLQMTFMAGKPKHQKKVETKIFEEIGRKEVEADILRRLKNKEPGYVICPLIMDKSSETSPSLLTTERKTIEAERKRLAEDFPEYRLGVLHGRLKTAEKEKIVSDFRAGEIDILLSTTVVEVGIDNPNATWILIEEADRFGLAQLHQLRGRVGRGERASICFLSDSNISPKGKERLQALSETDEGLVLAEADLRLRGPGELVGLEQSGLPTLKYFDWSDPEFFGRVFAEAKKIVNDGLNSYPELEKWLAENQ